MQSKKRRSETTEPDEPSPRPAKQAKQNLRIFVRRGALRRFARLTRDSRMLPVDIEWDRRQEERREEPKAPSAERRKTNRRRRPPFTWEMADFVVTESKRKKDEE